MHHPDTHELAELPRVLIDLLASKSATNSAEPTRMPMPSHNGPDAYIRAAFDSELAKVRAATIGTRNDTLNRAAFALGQFIGGGHLDRAEVESQLTGAALAAGLGEREARATIQSGIEAGLKEPREISGRNSSTPLEDILPDFDPVVPEPGTPPLETAPRAQSTLAQQAGALYAAQVKVLADAFAPRPKLPSVVAGILPTRSLTVWYGSPGYLKTNLLLDLCMAVATGSPWLPTPPPDWLGGITVSQCPVLWLDIDCGEDVISERLAAFARAYHAPRDALFYYLSFPSPPMMASKGLPGLTEIVKDRGIGLIVIDNLLRVAVGAAVETPQRLVAVEATACGEKLTDELIAVIADEYARSLDPLSDARGSAWYRREMIRVFVRRALLEVRDGDR